MKRKPKTQQKPPNRSCFKTFAQIIQQLVWERELITFRLKSLSALLFFFPYSTELMSI